MFSQITLTNLKSSPRFGYARALPFFKNKRQLVFKPGLNILFGPNGSGKSTVLHMLGETMSAVQGGVSTVTQRTVHETVDMMAGRDRSQGMVDKLGLDVMHDGQPVVFCDPRDSVGLDSGAFDDDFFSQGFAEVQLRHTSSHGQLSVHRLNTVLAVLLDKAPFPKEVAWKIKRGQVNDMWQQALDVVQARMQARIDPAQPTVLLDEPEANYSLPWQARLWSLLAREAVAAKFQLIVASHSPFALGIPHAHYIDLAGGFRQEAEAALRAKFGQPG